MQILTVKDLDFHFSPQKVVFDKASFSLDSDNICGLVGKNGSGKSTLFDIVSQKIEADKGDIITPKNLVISKMQQSVKAAGTIGHFLNKDYDDLTQDHKELISFLKIPSFEIFLKTLSGGQLQRLSLAKTLMDHADLYLLDEPTNHLDLETIQKLELFISKSSSSFMIVSHDRYFLDRVCNKIIEIDKAKIYEYRGGYKSFLKSKQIRNSVGLEKQRKKEEFLTKEKHWVDSGVKARETKNRARLKRYYEILDSGDFSIEKQPKLQLPNIKPFGKKILNLKNLEVGIDNLKFIKDFDFEFQEGYKIGIVGNNGAGKTTIVKTLIGQIEPAKGKVIQGINTEINYISQEKDDLNYGNTVFDEITEKTPMVSFGDKKINAFFYLSQYLFESEKLDSMVSQLSGGEKARLALAKEIKKGGNFLVLDEPTNDLDIDMIEVLEKALMDFKGCELIISHDRFFLDKICTHILYIFGDGRYLLSHGNWSDFEKKYQDSLKPTKVQSKKINKNDPYQKFINRQIEQKRKKSKDLETLIEKYEAEKSKTEIAISQPNLYNSDLEKFTKLTKRLEFLNSKIDELWENLSSLI